MYDFDTTSNCVSQPIHQINNVLIPPRDHDLVHMRHHVHCQDLHGVVGYYPQHNNNSSIERNGTEKVINSNNIVERNTEVILGGESSINYFNK